MFLSLSPHVNACKAERQRLRIQVDAVGRHAGLSTYVVRRIERGAETDPARIERYCRASELLTATVRESLARLDQIAASGVRPMTPAELRDAVTGGGV